MEFTFLFWFLKWKLGNSASILHRLKTLALVCSNCIKILENAIVEGVSSVSCYRIGVLNGRRSCCKVWIWLDLSLDAETSSNVSFLDISPTYSEFCIDHQCAQYCPPPGWSGAARCPWWGRGVPIAAPFTSSEWAECKVAMPSWVQLFIHQLYWIYSDHHSFIPCRHPLYIPNPHFMHLRWRLPN